jgi:hypothetical protein
MQETAAQMEENGGQGIIITFVPPAAAAQESGMTR